MDNRQIFEEKEFVFLTLFPDRSTIVVVPIYEILWMGCLVRGWKRKKESVQRDVKRFKIFAQKKSRMLNL